MERKSCLLIINPISGTAAKKGLDKIVLEKLAPSFDEIEVCWTAAKGDATVRAGEAVAQGFHSVIVAGGDGTVNETATALCGSSTALGILPFGSGNGLARHMEIPIDLSGALGIIEKNHIEACDYGTVNGRPFFCTFGVGFDAQVSRLFAAQKHRGPLSYVKSALAELSKYREEKYVISANGSVITEKAFLIAVCNASQYGNNAYIAPKASITDGFLDITVIHQGNPVSTAIMGLELMAGYLDRDTSINSLKVKSAVISRSAPGAAHIDGDPVMMGEELVIGCVPAGINIYTNPRCDRFRPIITPMKSLFDDIGNAIRRRT